MNSLLLFRFRAPERDESTLVVFTASERIDSTELVDTLNEDLSVNLKPDRLVFVVRDDVVLSAVNDIQNLISRPGELRIDPREVASGVIGFDLHGDVSNQRSISSFWKDIDTAEYEKLKSRGVTEIFIRRDGLIKPGPGVHYVHPSGRHSRAFIRAANVLISGPEVMFVASTLLGYLGSQTEFIWTDTSSIASLAYALVAIRKSMEHAFRNPVIGSFSSYGGVDNTPFSRLDKSLCLVSATTSGNLGRKIINLGFPAPRVVNIFSLAADAKPAQILCDLYSDEDINPNKQFSSNNEFSAANCPMCRNGSKMVHFVGDQFLAEAITYGPYVFRYEDLPRSTSDALRKFVCNNIFGIKAKNLSNDTTANNFWIDVPKLISEGTIKSLIQNAAKRYLPVSADIIISTDEPAAHKIARMFADAVGERVKTAPLIKTFAEVENETFPEAPQAAVVVTSCIDSGTSLQRVSRALRNPLGNNPRVYIGIFAKHSHLAGFETLRGDLTYNDAHLPHGFHCLYRLSLPVLPKRSAWTHELEMLQDLILRIRRKQDGYPQEATPEIEGRIDILQRLSQGSCNNLFWPVTGGALKLRQTFAFWRFQHKADEASDGDVLTTIASLLENLRIGSQAPLRSTAFYQGVVSPSCFGRFNDGIIQAAILRSALPQELNFESEPEISQVMLGILQSVLSTPHKAQGEASFEFLVSLATNRLRIMPAHLEQLLADSGSGIPVQRALVKYISDMPRA